MMDWESHRILTQSGRLCGLVYTLGSGRVVVKRRIDLYATVDSFYESLIELEKTARRRRWKLERVRHFG